MKNFPRIILAICVVVALSFAGVANAAPAKGGHVNTDQPSLFKTGDVSVGLGFTGVWSGGIDLTGSYFFTDNVAVQADLVPVTYTVLGTTASTLYIDIMGVYHMAFADNVGAYGGLGLGIGSVTILGTTYSVGGLAYTVGAEMFFTDNLRGHLGILTGGLNAGIDMTF